jgi:hypothetical protein
LKSILFFFFKRCKEAVSLQRQTTLYRIARTLLNFKEIIMWKILVAFILFAGAALFFIFKAGDKVDMQGEAAGASPTEVHASATETSSSANAPSASSASK